MGLSKYELLFAVVILYLILGCFFEGLSMMVMTLPLVFPLMMSAGFDPVWFGVIVTILIEVAVVTPPVGLNLFVITAITNGEVTLAEVLAPTKSRGQAKPELRVYYLDLLTSGRFVNLHPVSRDLLYDTSSLREQGPLRLVDAIHLATGMRAGCSYLVSRDAGFSRFSTLMEIAAPGSPAFQQLIAALQ